ncbi:hypothetical protein SAMN07250955_107192 [Arboricoccus pini]|uniref:Serine aminopeptidase S33 domain-containing protein n=1 Tax=Arboricoccus pini TaxID=1963835 RepID=A0A212RDP0_9PROT|nr:alpha/beta hydrolase [Arboricoccus pini]SNB70415.1 hypothetical protein SAMN07250955_107192 [Arboricoccus pini]
MRLVVKGAVAYGAVLAGLYWLQDSMLFPKAEAAIAAYPLPKEARPLALRTADGYTIHGHHLPAREPSRGLMIAFPGNGWNAEDFLFFLGHKLADFDLVAFHYRGYGPNAGRPGERAFFADALSIHEALTAELRPKAVYTAGFSIGTGVAGYLASMRPVAGTLLVTPFDSMEAIARQRFPWAPTGLLLRHRFRTATHLAGSDVPVAMIMAGDDKIVPPARSLALRQALRRVVFASTIPKVGHSAIYEDERFDEALNQAMLHLEGAAEDPARVDDDRRHFVPHSLPLLVPST